MGFRVITFAVVMAAGQVVLEARLAGVNDGRSEKDVTLGLALVEGVILVANGSASCRMRSSRATGSRNSPRRSERRFW